MIGCKHFQKRKSSYIKNARGIPPTQYPIHDVFYLGGGKGEGGGGTPVLVLARGKEHTPVLVLARGRGAPVLVVAGAQLSLDQIGAPPSFSPIPPLSLTRTRTWVSPPPQKGPGTRDRGTPQERTWDQRPGISSPGYPILLLTDT